MNMPILTQFGNSEQSMNSLDVSELVQSRHDVVKKSIERLVQDKAIIQPPMADVQTVDSMGRARPVQAYLFSGEQGKLDSITVVAQLSPRFTAAIVKRWYELEQKAVQPQITTPHDYLSALKALVESEEQKQIAQQQLAIAAPKVQYFDRVADVGNLMTASTVGKKLGMSAQVLNEHLKPLKVYDLRQAGKIFAQWFIDKGFGEVKKTSNGYNTSKFTNKGEQWIVEKLTSEGII